MIEWNALLDMDVADVLSVFLASGAESANLAARFA